MATEPSATIVIVNTRSGRIEMPGFPGHAAYAFGPGRNTVSLAYLDALEKAGYGKAFYKFLDVGYLEFEKPPEAAPERAAPAPGPSDEELIDKVSGMVDPAEIDALFRSGVSNAVGTACLLRQEELNALPAEELTRLLDEKGIKL